MVPHHQRGVGADWWQKVDRFCQGQVTSLPEPVQREGEGAVLRRNREVEFRKFELESLLTEGKAGAVEVSLGALLA